MVEAPRLEPHVADLVEALPVWRAQDQGGFDADALGPAAKRPQGRCSGQEAAVLEPCHQVGVAETPVRQQADLTNTHEVQEAFGLCKHLEQFVCIDLGTGMLDRVHAAQLVTDTSVSVLCIRKSRLRRPFSESLQEAQEGHLAGIRGP